GIEDEAEEGQWGAHVSWTEPAATDNCEMQSTSATHAPGDFFNVGSTEVSYTALDIHGNSSTCSFTVEVSPPDILGSVNLSIFANDIQFSNSNPAPGTFINVSATVHNNSNVAAASFVCHLLNQYDNTTYPDIIVPALAANQSTVVTWNIQTPADPAFVPMQVTIDYLNNVTESNELDNQAIRPFVNGSLPFSGHIVVVANAIPYSAIAGSGISICGNAYYDDTAIPLIDSSVAGAQVTVTIAETGQVLYGVTNSNGYFCIGYSTPNTAGLYHFIAAVTDFTLTGDTTGTFQLVPPPVDYCPTDLSIGLELYGSFLCGNAYHIVQGSSLTGIVNIYNGCHSVSTPTTLFIALPDGTPVPGPYIIPSLAPGEAYSLLLPEMTFNTVGSTYISATVDFFNGVAEDNESNNSRSIPIQVHPPLPDITPTQGWVSTDYQCETASVSFRIDNTGGIPTGGFNTVLEIYQGSTLETSFTQTVSSIPALCYTYVTFVFDPQFSGEYHFNLYCDTMPSVVTELSEVNNSLSMTHFFQPCNFDLVVHGCGSMDVKPTNPVSPGSITLYATIGNYGQLPVTTPFVVNFIAGETTYPVPVTQTISANSSVNVSVTIPTPAFGNNDLTVEVDANHEVTELNESNNTNSAKLCWDFVLTNTSCSGGSPLHGTQFICNPIQLAIGLYNLGLYEASNLKVKFEVSGPGISGWSNLGFATVFVDNTCGCPQIVNLSSSFLFPQTGFYDVRITADFQNLYTECFEDNNQLVLPVQVVENADYSVYSQFIAPSELNPDINEPVTFNLTYKNEGCTGLSPVELYMQMDNTPHDSVSAIALASNALNTYSMSQPWSSALPGVHVIRAVIDHDQALVESNELNNEATRSIIVGGAPNFNLFALGSSNMSPLQGETVSLTCSIINEGQNIADGTLQFYFVNAQEEEVLIDQQSIHLAEGETLDKTVLWFVTYPYAKIIARISNVDPVEYDFTDNEQQLKLSSLAVAISSTDVACNGIALGILEASINGGQPPYFVQWSNGFTGEIVNVPAGIYSVLVTDVNGLQAYGVDTVNALAIPVTWYADADQDGYGNGSLSLLSCTTPEGYVLNTEDCDDTDASIHPLATEVCDTKDNDCDGFIDDADTSVVGQALWYQDYDGDNYGNPDIFLSACYQPGGYVGTGTDCDDNDADKHPDGNEVLDGKDNDCDGLIDEGLSVISVDAGDCMVVYHGYAPTECAVLNVNVQGGAEPYIYNWS
ncbi:MAG TPA: CARDB domain-containing protein, partial [Saprospiraceae bacterium]|nr:CARDB domain-containing protein [Saprospiraceae bacterium]